MSTRGLIRVYSDNSPKKTLEAQFYVHCDAYVKNGVGDALVDFVNRLADGYTTGAFSGTRFDDPNYLAPRLLVYLATDYYKYSWKDLLSLGVLPTDKNMDCGQNYTYDLFCSKSPAQKPEIQVTNNDKTWYLLQNKSKVETRRDSNGKFAKKERIVCFSYDGEFRTLKVTKEDANFYEGIDLHKDSFRRFSKARMVNVKEI